MKARLLELVRAGHLILFQGVLPKDVAIYFHELEEHQLPQFSAAVRFFLDNGYRTVDAGELLDPGAEGKRLFISFDDNFRSWHRALGLFERLGVTCTFYVNSGVFRDLADPADIGSFFDRIAHAGTRETLTTRELAEIAAAGHTIGCHTHTHPVLSRLGEEHWPAEIARSKQRLEEIVGRPVLDFSFPFGMRRHFSRRLRDYCRATGFRSVATGMSGLQHASPRDPLALHRTGWKFSRSCRENIADIQVDSRLYAAVTGRSALG